MGVLCWFNVGDACAEPMPRFDVVAITCKGCMYAQGVVCIV